MKKDPKIKIRQANIDDAGAIASILRELEWAAQIKEEPQGETQARVAHHMEMCAADDSHSILVAEFSANAVVGFVSVHWLPYMMLAGLEMNREAIIFQDVLYRYETMSAPLFENLAAHFPIGWTGIVGANGVGKTTILKLAAGELTPHHGRIQMPSHSIYCPQRTDEAPPLFDDLVKSTDSDACKIKGMLEIDDDWPQRWDTLSHGERKRAQIGVVLWSRPEALAVDEPTNHLDAEARDLLANALHSFRGIGLLVSHDRELLDALCGQCLFVEPDRITMRPGGYTQSMLEAEQEDEHVRKQQSLAKATTKKLKRQVADRRESASRARRRLSKRGLGLKDHAARDKIDLAQVTGKDATDGKRLRQVQGRLKQAQKIEKQFKIRKTYKMGIWMEGSCSKRDTLFHLPSGRIPLGADRELRFDDLVMKPTDRLAITGPNGAGKSTLVRHILKNLNLPTERLTYLPQEINLQASGDIMDRARNLPKDILGHLMTVVSCLGSRPQRLLESAMPSPGEIRKILLAMGIAQTTHLIIMDEPTNHLDLPSIECLEDALRNCPCGLLLVSHDRRFLDNLSDMRWHISRSDEEDDLFEVHKL